MGVFIAYHGKSYERGFRGTGNLWGNLHITHSLILHGCDTRFFSTTMGGFADPIQGPRDSMRCWALDESVAWTWGKLSLQPRGWKSTVLGLNFPLKAPFGSGISQPRLIEGVRFYDPFVAILLGKVFFWRDLGVSKLWDTSKWDYPRYGTCKPWVAIPYHLLLTKQRFNLGQSFSVMVIFVTKTTETSVWWNNKNRKDTKHETYLFQHPKWGIHDRRKTNSWNLKISLWSSQRHGDQGVSARQWNAVKRPKRKRLAVASSFFEIF